MIYVKIKFQPFNILSSISFVQLNNFLPKVNYSVFIGPSMLHYYFYITKIEFERI